MISILRKYNIIRNYIIQFLGLVMKLCIVWFNYHNLQILEFFIWSTCNVNMVNVLCRFVKLYLVQTIEIAVIHISRNILIVEIFNMNICMCIARSAHQQRWMKESLCRSMTLTLSIVHTNAKIYKQRGCSIWNLFIYFPWSSVQELKNIINK